MRDAKLANQFKNEHPTSWFNARPFSKEISKERGFIKSLPGHSRLAVTISLDSVALRIDLALLSGISNTEKTGSFSSNFSLELGFRDRRSFWDESPFTLDSPFSNFKKLSFGLCDLFPGLRRCAVDLEFRHVGHFGTRDFRSFCRISLIL